MTQRELYALVHADSRVIAAKQALDVFNETPDGMLLDAATHTKAAFAAVPEHIKDRYAALAVQWRHAVKAVRAELEGVSA